MRHVPSFCLTLMTILGFAGAAAAADKPQLELEDNTLPLWEIRPLDRRDYILSLDGKWNEAPINGVAYYVNFFFPDGGSYAHRVLSDYRFGLGEVRCIIQDYQFINHGLDKGGKFTVVVSARKAAAALDADNVVSNPIEESWPMKRAIQTRPVLTKHSPAPPAEALPFPDEQRPVAPVPVPVPPPAPPPVPEKN